MKRSCLLLLPLLLGACGDNPSVSSKGNENAQWKNAENLKNSGDLTGAARIYEDLARTSPHPVDAQIELAGIDRRLGKSEDAVLVMRDAQKHDPNNPKVISQLAYSLIDAGHPEDAVTLFDGMIHEAPDNAMAYSGKGVAFDRAGNHLAAQDLYKQALKLAPATLSIENNLAMSLILNNQLDQAIPILAELVHTHPDNKVVRHNLALAYGLSGQKDKAMQLNLMDLPPEQAKENEKFYSYYARLRDKYTESDMSGMQIGFSETPEDDKDIEPPHTTIKPKAVAYNEQPPIDDDEPEEDAKTDDTPKDTPIAAAPVEPAEAAPSAGPETVKTLPVEATLPAPTAALGTVLPTSKAASEGDAFPSQHRR